MTVALFAGLLAAFVILHIALANPPLRDGMVAKLGERGFMIGYSLLSLLLLVLALQVYKQLPEEPLWTVGIGAYHSASLLMWIASILFVGSFTPANRALAGVPASDRPVSGVLGITRHPMMWAFGIWAIVHGWLAGDLPTLILAIGIGVLALGGSWLQDGKKRAQMGASWDRYEARTSWLPFWAIISGRQPVSALWPGVVPLVGGTAFWLLLTWLHPSLMRAPVVGIWGMVQ